MAEVDETIDNNTACDNGSARLVVTMVIFADAHSDVVSLLNILWGTIMNDEHSLWIGRYVQYHGVSCRSTENDHHSFWFSFAGGAYQICKFRTHLSSLSPLRMGLQQHQSSTTTPQQHQSSTITTSILFSLQYYSNNNNNYYHDQCEFPQLVSTMVI